jgi:hypothetical protein
MHRSRKSEQQRGTAFFDNVGGCSSLITIPPISVLIVSVFIIIGVVSISNSDSPKISTDSEEPDSLPLAPLFTPEVLYWDTQILNWAIEWDLDPNLIATVMQIESCGDPSAQSYVGAMGLFQVMPFHFLPGENPLRPETNALRGLDYLHSALDASEGDPRLALVGYNGGISNINRAESSWPDETKRYIKWGYNIYNDAQHGKNRSPYLEEWLESGGASLCSQARERLGLTP